MRYEVRLRWAAGGLVFPWSESSMSIEAANGAEAIALAIKERDKEPGSRKGPMEHFGYYVKAASARPADPMQPGVVLEDVEPEPNKKE